MSVNIHRLRFIFFSPLLIWAQVAAPQTNDEPADDLVFSCDAFPRDFTEDDLRARFGAENVVRDQVIFFDDGPQETTVVFPDDPSRRLFVTWFDPENGPPPGGVRITDLDSRWRTIDGLSTGDPLRAVEQANGWPFRLNPLTFEGGGRIRSWGQGRLTDLDAALPDCRMTIGFDFRPGTAVDPLLVRQISSPLIRDLPPLGLSSGHLALQALNPVIDLIAISYPLSR